MQLHLWLAISFKFQEGTSWQAVCYMCSFALVLEKQSNTLTPTTQLNLQQQYFKSIKKINSRIWLICWLQSAPDSDHCKNRLGWSFDSKRIVMEGRPNQTVDDSPQHRRHGPATPSKQPVAPSNKVDTASVSQRSLSLEFPVWYPVNFLFKKEKEKPIL